MAVTTISCTSNDQTILSDTELQATIDAAVELALKEKTKPISTTVPTPKAESKSKSKNIIIPTLTSGVPYPTPLSNPGMGGISTSGSPPSNTKSYTSASSPAPAPAPAFRPASAPAFSPAPAPATAIPQPSFSQVAPKAKGNITIAWHEIMGIKGQIHKITGIYPLGIKESDIKGQRNGNKRYSVFQNALGEHLFSYKSGNPLTPQMAKDWSISSDGKTLSITLNKGMKWNSSKYSKDINSDNLVSWFNLINSNENPNSVHPDAETMSSFFTKAEKVDEYTFNVGMVDPLYFCLPLSEFGCFDTAPIVYLTDTQNTMGEEWAKKNIVTSAPYTQGNCEAGDRCSLHAVNNHWRASPKVDKITYIQVPESGTQLAMLATGEVDIATVDYDVIDELLSAQTHLKTLETMPGLYNTLSISFAGNFWTEYHPDTGEQLYSENISYDDKPWIGNPWPEKIKNNSGRDSNNPAGISDMEQARLVRQAISIGIDRNKLANLYPDDLVSPLYSEYLFSGIDNYSLRESGIWDVNGNKLSEFGGNKYYFEDFDISNANSILNNAGYNKNEINRFNISARIQPGFFSFPLGFEWSVSNSLSEDLNKLGITFVASNYEDWGGMIKPRYKRRENDNPLITQSYLLEDSWNRNYPIPREHAAYSSVWSNPEFSLFESEYYYKTYNNILKEKNSEIRKNLYLNVSDYNLYWMQSIGLLKIKNVLISNKRIKSWEGPIELNKRISSNPELIILE